MTWNRLSSRAHASDAANLTLHLKRPRPSMEPRPRGRGRKGGRLTKSARKVLQWSPDLAVGEGGAVPLRRVEVEKLQWSPDLAVGEGAAGGTGQEVECHASM